MTPAQHKFNWNHCALCSLHEHRTTVVLWRGQTNGPDILFIGEAPGESEDLFAEPFIGPAGKLLDQIIETAQVRGQAFTTCFTNVVACYPTKLDDYGNRVSSTPEKIHLDACDDRLQEFIELTDPQLIIAVGKTAQKHLTTDIYDAAILHPAFILRQPERQQSTLFYQTVSVITELVKTLVPF